MQLKNIFKEVFVTPYLYGFIIVFLLYIALAIIISQFYITIIYIPKYLQTIKWSELIVGILFTLIIAFLVSINSVLSYKKYKQKKNIRKCAAITSVGTIGGLSTGVCSICVSGLFPFIFSLFGITFTWTFLPFNGLEIQLLVIILLSLSLYFFVRN